MDGVTTHELARSGTHRLEIMLVLSSSVETRRMEGNSSIGVFSSYSVVVQILFGEFPR